MEKSTQPKLVQGASGEDSAKLTLTNFRSLLSCMTSEGQLTQVGRELAGRYKWPFEDDEYLQAWKFLFKRASQLNLRYCKHFKRFYKPLPPKPVVGARVRLTSVSVVGTVTGYDRFDLLVLIDGTQKSVPVGAEYLETL